MKQCLLLFFLLSAAHLSAAKPPPQEVYAIASDGTQLTWTAYTPTGKGRGQQCS